MSKNIYSGICPRCQKTFTKEIEWGYIPKFCSRSCANSRGLMTDEQKEYRRQFALQNPKGWHLNEQFGSEKDSNKYKQNICPTCSKPFNTLISDPRVFCSSNCIRLGGFRQESYRHGKKGIYKNIFCDSTWELAYLIYCMDHDIDIKRNTTAFQYVHPNNNKKYNYYPDFIVNNEYIEIKGMMNEVAKAKADQNPKVKLLQKNDLREVFEYIKNTYNKPQNRMYELYDIELN